MTINLQSMFISSLYSEKNKWLSNERKKFYFEGIRMAGVCRMLFKPCHQPSLKKK